jgi:hypothetical protein
VFWREYASNWSKVSYIFLLDKPDALALALKCSANCWRRASIIESSGFAAMPEYLHPIPEIILAMLLHRVN